MARPHGIILSSDMEDIYIYIHCEIRYYRPPLLSLGGLSMRLSKSLDCSLNDNTLLWASKVLLQCKDDGVYVIQT